VPEATNDVDELFGTDRMLEALNKKPDGNPMEVIENVQAGINEFVNGAEQFDDITMLSFQYIGPEKS
jgi:sigma-B regulation protein RsbU (phosphoserine phosphatase)